MKRVALLGATGSIGTQVIEIIQNRPQFDLVAISAHTNKSALSFLQKKYKIQHAALSSELSYSSNDSEKFYSGIKWYEELIDASQADIVINAIIGFAGLLPSYYSLKKGLKLLLANKEAIVAGGNILIPLARENKAEIIPIDSEHSAIFQCLKGEKLEDIRKVFLTASGGPFLGYNKKQLESIEPQQAINHPVWNMGAKISVDSATMMNKGLECIEAHWLFNLDVEQIDFVLHPSATVHSMVEFVDGSIKAQMGYPDMRVPIRYALSYPNRFIAQANEFEWKDLSFKKLKKEEFLAIELAVESLKIGGTAACVLNAANEAAVHAFLNKKIKFTEIINWGAKALNRIDIISDPDLEQLMATHKETIEFVNKNIY